jgi:hypothetical protein
MRLGFAFFNLVPIPLKDLRFSCARIQPIYRVLAGFGIESTSSKYITIAFLSHKPRPQSTSTNQYPSLPRSSSDTNDGAAAGESALGLAEAASTGDILYRLLWMSVS